jgi:hypothetical protein
MQKIKHTVAYLMVLTFIAGCAGSAQHKVVSSNQAGDGSLTCEQISGEIVKTQVIIDDVNKDKDDISGADVVDGILWFPFNLIAKNNNYKDALEAAGNRIKALKDLRKEKNCSVASASASASKAEGLAAELQKLGAMREKGLLTNEEYMEAKKKLLDKF